MNNYNYTKEDIINSLKKVGLKKGDNVFTHSNLGFFGKLKDASTKEKYYKKFKEAFFEVIGKEGTLIIPTFSYSFCKKEKFSIKETKGLPGIMSEMALLDEEGIRSNDPNFSIVAIGKNAKYFTENPPPHSFGKNCFWERFLEKNGVFCNLNFDSGSTFIHYIEKILDVPYRYDKEFYGIKEIKDKEVFSNSFHFVYDLDIPEHSPDFSKMDKKIKEKNICNCCNLGKGSVLLISAKDKLDLIENEIKNNPEYLIKGPLKINKRASEMYGLMKEVYPFCRSITGQEVVKTLEHFNKYIEIEIKQLPSGTKVFDWIVPKEWNIKDAYVKDSNGNKIIDFKKHNVNVVNYSIPINKKIQLNELKNHLHSLEKYPFWTPYLTTYYKENWGFCISHNEYLKLKGGEYEVLINSELEEGNITWGEIYIPGKSEKEILFRTYICHPSLCNDNLSGPILAVFLAREIKKLNLNYSYRFLFIPETIGAITWLSQNQDKVKNIMGGYVLTCVGDRGNLTYKETKYGNSYLDKVALKALEDSKNKYSVLEFTPNSDERQFSSPAFEIELGSIMRTPYAKYPEYHTSADNLSFICPIKFEETLSVYERVISILENDCKCKIVVKCEPQLGKRGLYGMIGGQKDSNIIETSFLWLSVMGDGKNTLLDIAIKSKIDFNVINKAKELLKEKEILDVIK